MLRTLNGGATPGRAGCPGFSRRRGRGSVKVPGWAGRVARSRALVRASAVDRLYIALRLAFESLLFPRAELWGRT